MRPLGAAFALAAAIALAAFLGGYVTGYQRSDGDFDAARSVVLGTGPMRAIVRFAAADANGNRRMLVTAQGLPQTKPGNYYVLLMTKMGKPIVTCGTFKVGSDPLTTVRFTIGYEVEDFDGLLLAEYRHADRKDHPLLRAKLA